MALGLVGYGGVAACADRHGAASVIIYDMLVIAYARSLRLS